MRSIRAFTVWPLLLLAGLGGGSAAATGLSADEQAMLEELLGSGVVGEPVAGSTLTAKFAPMHSGSWTYQVVSGKRQGQSEQHVVKRLENAPSGADWRYAIEDVGAVSIDQAEDATLTFVSQEDLAQSVITRYQPAEPGLLVGLAPGESRTSSIAVEVADISSPDEVSHTGKLDVTYTYLGAYKVTTPAGTYDAALIKWTYKGRRTSMTPNTASSPRTSAWWRASTSSMSRPCWSITTTRRPASCWPSRPSSTARVSYWPSRGR